MGYSFQFDSSYTHPKRRPANARHTYINSPSAHFLVPTLEESFQFNVKPESCKGKVNECCSILYLIVGRARMRHIGLHLSATKRIAKKVILATVAVFSLVLLAFGGASKPLTTTSNLEYLLSQRISIREWSSTPVPNDVLKTICGLSLVSAFDLKGIGLYVMNSSGTYEYDDEGNAFIMKSTTDSRNELGLDTDQTFIAEAPCIIMLAWNSQLEADPLQAYRKAGIVVQNLYVLSIRHNLGGVCIGDSIYANGVSISIQQHLGLPSNLKPTILFPLGYLHEGQSYPTGTPQSTSGNLPTPLQSNIDILELLQNQQQLAVNWENISIAQNKLSNILWGAYGYSLLMTGHRTVPSAYGEYSFQIYACNETGVYNYTAENHSLHKTGSADKRATIIQHANGPGYLNKAPALLVFCWNSRVGVHNASDSDSGGRFINVDFGCCLQDLYLSATLWNCSLSTPLNTINYDMLRNDLSTLPLTDVYPIFLIGLGERLTDVEPPLIGTPHTAPAANPQPSQEVVVSVNVTDADSGVKNVTLSYSTDNGTLWIDIPMEYNSSSGMYETVIPEQPAGTTVKYEITAFDFADNKFVENNLGTLYVYAVIPEFTVTTLWLILLLAAISILAAKKKLAHA